MATLADATGAGHGPASAMMTSSMTGFARAAGSLGPIAWSWEVRSVNGRGLDIRSRLPPGLDALEPRVRAAVSKRLGRGSISLSLNLQRGPGSTEVRVNAVALEQVIAALEGIRARLGAPAPRAEALLGVKGVVEIVERTDDEAEARVLSETLLASLSEALDGLVRARSAEGGRLAGIIAGQLDAIARLVGEIEAAPARSPAAIRERLQEQVARILETGAALDEVRLHQEVALLATRADVTEELQRMLAHIAAARELLTSQQPAGRQLEFLAQEFNREANTLCAKAGDADTTRAGLALKVVVDQMREQVQNIE
jgi:uncharacterized protein (TIGR00255 family)